MASVPGQRGSLGLTGTHSQPKSSGGEVVGKRCDYSGLLLKLFCAWGMYLFACSEFRSMNNAHVHSVRVTDVFKLGQAISESGSERQEDGWVGFRQ